MVRRVCHKPRPWHQIANKLIHIIFLYIFIYYIALHYLLPHECQRITVHQPHTYTHTPTQNSPHSLRLHVCRHIFSMFRCSSFIFYYFLLHFHYFPFLSFPLFITFSHSAHLFCMFAEVFNFHANAIVMTSVSYLYIYTYISICQRKDCNNQRSAEAWRVRNGTKCKRQTPIAESFYMYVHIYMLTHNSQFTPSRKLAT